MIDVLGSSGGGGDLPLLVAKLQASLITLVDDSKVYVDTIREGLPPIRLPKFMFKTGGCYGFFEGKLKPFLE